jgi:hypothetical protein
MRILRVQKLRTLCCSYDTRILTTSKAVLPITLIKQSDERNQLWEATMLSIMQHVE